MVIALVASAVVLVLALTGSLIAFGAAGSGPLAFMKPIPTVPPTATPLPTATPTPSLPPPPAGFSTYLSSDYSWGIYYPSNWNSTNTSGIELFMSADTSQMLLVYPSPAQLAPSDYSAFLKSFAQGFGGTNVRVGTSPTLVTIGANTWNKLASTMTRGGTDVTVTVYGTDHAGSTYLLLLVAPTATFSATNTADYQPMLQSFTFLK